MYDTDILEREYRKMLGDLDKEMRRNQRKRRKAESRLNREYMRSLKCNGMPSEPCRSGKAGAFISKSLGFFLATLILAAGVLI